MNIGEIIKSFRKERKMTLVELSSKSGVALATLSRMENGKMTGTLGSHMRIAEALEVKLTDLYRNLELKGKKVEIKTKANRADAFIHGGKAASEMLTSRILNKKMMPVMVRINKGGVTHKEETKPGAEKFVYVLDGRIEANVGEERYHLTRGDTLYFEASVPHYFKNSGPGEARFISVISPPVL